MTSGRASRCKRDGCGAEIVFFRSPYTGNLRAFDARPLDGRDPGMDAFPVLGRTAYKFPVLVELIQVQRQGADVEAEREVRDMPWHALHNCTNSSTHTETHHRVEAEKETTHP